MILFPADCRTLINDGGVILNLILIANIITCVCAFIGFIYGIVKFFQPKKAVYAQMITLAAGCMAFGRLYQVVRLLTQGDILNEFQLGIFGVIGSLVFFFSANFGLMDSLADDRSKKYLKYRIIPLVAPALVIALYLIFIAFADMPKLLKITGAVVAFFAIQTTYFNLKHLIFPDVDYGVIKCLKLYNLLVLIYGFLCVAETISMNNANDISICIIGALMGIILLVVVPTVERGINKWTT